VIRFAGLSLVRLSRFCRCAYIIKGGMLILRAAFEEVWCRCCTCTYIMRGRLLRDLCIEFILHTDLYIFKKKASSVINVNWAVLGFVYFGRLHPSGLTSWALASLTALRLCYAKLYAGRVRCSLPAQGSDLGTALTILLSILYAYLCRG
jgi:hypothetical protein